MTSLISEDRGAVRILTLNRPARHNALDTGLMQALIEALRHADTDDGVRALVLTGAGKSFCSGADTSELSGAVEDPTAVTRRADLIATMHGMCAQMTKPVVAAVRGYALGGGAGLAIDCDLVVAAEDVRIGYPEVKRGLVGGIVMANLVRQVGRKLAFELVALGEAVDGHQAMALGMVNRVVPSEQVLDCALGLAETLAGWSPIAMAATKRTFHRACELSLSQALDAGRDTSLVMRGFRSGADKGG